MIMNNDASKLTITWGKFKKLVEEKGVMDGDLIDIIDTSGVFYLSAVEVFRSSEDGKITMYGSEGWDEK